MHAVQVNWSAVVLGAILFGAVVIAAATYYLLEHQRIRVEERRLDREFEHEVAVAPRMSWDGEQYEWTPETMAFLNAQLDSNPALTAPQPAVPASSISGPLPVQQPLLPAPSFSPREADDVLDRIRASNEEFMTRWAIR